MAVREKLDELFSGAALSDLEFPADQRAVAAIVFGLKLLADSIDEIEGRTAVPAGPQSVRVDLDLEDLNSNVENMTEQIEELKEQIRKLAKVLKKLAKDG